MSLKSWHKCFGSLIISAVLLVLLSGVFSQANADTITTIAGQGGGVSGFAGDGGPATAAKFGAIYDITKDSAGNIYAADTYNHRIRKIDTAGIVTTVVGTGAAGSSGDGGSATAAQINTPCGVAFDRAGNMFIAETYGHRIRKVNTSGTISTVAGTGTVGYSGDGGPATAAQLNRPQGIAFDSAGNIYISDAYNFCVRKISTSGIISTFAGRGSISGLAADGGPATAAKFNGMAHITTDSSDNLYIPDAHCIRKVDSAGIISTVAGNGTAGYSGDGGPAVSALINQPYSVGFDSGNLYITELAGQRVRKVNSAGIISTVAGNGTQGFSGDGGEATSAQTYNPSMAIQDNAGNILIADCLNHCIRKVTISTRIIGVSGSLTFGDVIVSKTKQLTMTVSNSGNSALTVSSVSYPAGFSGNWSGTIAAGGSRNITVTFSPTAVQAYTGTVTVNSDKTAGTDTIAISGNGIADPCQCTDTNGSTQQGIDLVKANPGSYQLFTQAQNDAARQAGIQFCKDNPASCGLLSQAQSDQAVKNEQLKWDANGDGKIGLEDIIRMLQVIAGLRP